MTNVVEFKLKPKPDLATRARGQLKEALGRKLIGIGSAELCEQLATAAVDAMQAWGNAHVFTVTVDLKDQAATR